MSLVLLVTLRLKNKGGFMIYIFYEFTGFLHELIGSSRFMGPDGGIYDVIVSLIYIFLQLYVFFTPKFLERLPKHSIISLIVMIAIFLPGIMILEICRKISGCVKEILWRIQVVKIRRKRKHERKYIFSDY